MTKTILFENWLQQINLYLYSSERHSYLTWRDMSTQGGVLTKFHSSRLWTRPSKDQYLPAYFKQVCDEYMASENPLRVFPVEVGKHAISSLFNVSCPNEGFIQFAYF